MKTNVTRIGRSKRNTRFGAALKNSGLTLRELAARSGCHPKTVERWYYEGRVPRSAYAARVADTLDVAASWLWPVVDRSQPDDFGDRIRMFSRLNGEPTQIIRGILGSAENAVDVCSSSSWFLDRTATTALPRAKRIPLRVLIPPAVTWHGGYAPMTPGLRLRTHNDVGLLSLVRGDDAMVVVLNIGAEIAEAPAMFLLRSSQHGPFDQYADGFDEMWTQGSEYAGQDARMWVNNDARPICDEFAWAAM